MGELQSNVTIIAEYIMFQHFLGQRDPKRLRKAVGISYARNCRMAVGISIPAVRVS